MVDHNPPAPPSSRAPFGGLYDPADGATPYDTLLGAIDSVIGEWRALVEGEPWARIPRARLVDSLPEILPKLIRLARRGGTEVDPDLREMIATAHGFFRRQDGVPLVAVAEEWNHVKRACWKVMQGHGIDPQRATSALNRLDLLIDDAIGFSLRGYYGPELDSLRGRGLERRGNAPERRSGTGDRRGEA